MTHDPDALELPETLRQISCLFAIGSPHEEALNAAAARIRLLEAEVAHLTTPAEARREVAREITDVMVKAACAAWTPGKDGSRYEKPMRRALTAAFVQRDVVEGFCPECDELIICDGHKPNCRAADMLEE